MDILNVPSWLGNATGWGAFATLSVLVVLGFMTGRVFPAKVIDLYRQAYLDIKETKEIQDAAFRATMTEYAGTTLSYIKGFTEAAADKRRDEDSGAESR